MADDEDQSSKTQDPTERKLRQLREDGNVPTSREVNNFFALLGILLVVGVGFKWAFWRLGAFSARLMQDAGETPLESPQAVGAVMSSLGLNALVALLPLLVFLAVVGVFSGWIQTGGLFSTKPLEMNLNKISPLAGFKRMFSLKSVMELLKSTLKMAIIGVAMGAVMWRERETILGLKDMDVGTLLLTLQNLVLWLLGAAVALMFLLAVGDYLFQKMQFIIQNRMSARELKDEVRDTEGDPHIKGRQRQLRRERARKRMMAAVPKADVVITNPTHYACALRYRPDEGDAAPVLVAKGVDAVALRIRELATEHGIPLYEDPPLARQLYRDVELDETIPITLYEVVAKVVAFVAALKKK